MSRGNILLIKIVLIVMSAAILRKRILLVLMAADILTSINSLATCGRRKPCVRKRWSVVQWKQSEINFYGSRFQLEPSAYSIRLMTTFSCSNFEASVKPLPQTDSCA